MFRHNGPTSSGRYLLKVWIFCYYDSLVGWLVVLVFYGPLTHFMSFRARSVNLATLFLGKPPRQFTST